MKKKFIYLWVVGKKFSILSRVQEYKGFGTYNKDILPPDVIPALQEKFFEIEINIL